MLISKYKKVYFYYIQIIKFKKIKKINCLELIY